MPEARKSAPGTAMSIHRAVLPSAPLDPAGEMSTEDTTRMTSTVVRGSRWSPAVCVPDPGKVGDIRRFLLAGSAW